MLGKSHPHSQATSDVVSVSYLVKHLRNGIDTEQASEGKQEQPQRKPSTSGNKVDPAYALQIVQPKCFLTD